MLNIKKISFALLFVVASGISSCNDDFLDQVPDDNISIEEVFRRSESTLQFLANVYSHIRSEVDHNGGNTPWGGLSDEMDITYNGYPTYSMNLGNWDRNRGDYNYWGHYYRGIRAASYFMQNVDKNEDFEPEQKARYTAEARILRAYFYFMILRQYGPFIILPDTPIAPDATVADVSLPRNSYDECVDFLTRELDLAIAEPNLKEKYVGNDIQEVGHMNKAIAMAIKSRLLLYAASPLFNGNTDYANFKNKDGKQLINQQYDVNKWKKAADASKQLIDLNLYQLYKENDVSTGNFSPYLSLKGAVTKDFNSEIIFERILNDQGATMFAIDKNGSPYKVGGWSSWGATQSAVDSYFTANGRTIDDPQSGYVETGFTNSATPLYGSGTSNMYVNREPRFYRDITFNGSKWINNSFGTNGQPIIIEMYNGGNSGKYNGRNWSRTGYVVRKMVDPSSTLNPDRPKNRNEIKIRLAEIYLNYAEALNEYSPGHPDVVKYINLIRERAGIPLYGEGDNALPIPSGQAMKEAIRRERRVELAFENHRFFDTRRWKIASQTDGGPFYGMNIEATNTQGFTQRTVFETRTWNDKFYLWNIVQSELNKDQNLVENPGW